MAVESRIDADDEWFVGEDRNVRFTFVSGDTSGVEGWAMVFELYGRRAKEGDPPLLSVDAAGTAAVPAVEADPDADPPIEAAPFVPAYTQSVVDSAATTALGPGVYQFVLRRTDTGFKTILAFGPAELRSKVSA